MTKWSDIIRRLENMDDSNASSRAVKKMCHMPALMTVLEGNYRSSGTLKPVIKKRMIEVCDSIQSGSIPIGDVDPGLSHFVVSLKTYVHSSDPEVSRWATICEELDSNREVLSLMHSIARTDPSIETLCKSVISWTVSECNKRKNYILPYNGS